MTESLSKRVQAVLKNKDAQTKHRLSGTLEWYKSVFALYPVFSFMVAHVSMNCYTYYPFPNYPQGILN